MPEPLSGETAGYALRLWRWYRALRPWRKRLVIAGPVGLLAIVVAVMSLGARGRGQATHRAPIRAYEQAVTEAVEPSVIDSLVKDGVNRDRAGFIYLKCQAMGSGVRYGDPTMDNFHCTSQPVPGTNISGADFEVSVMGSKVVLPGADTVMIRPPR